MLTFHRHELDETSSSIRVFDAGRELEPHEIDRMVSVLNDMAAVVDRLSACVPNSPGPE